LVIGELTRSGALEAWQKSRVQLLKQSIQNLPTDKAREIILALNPTTYGDLNAQLLKKELEEYAGSITRLGRGIPTGGEIEFADIDTLSSSLERRV
jgi:recombination protein RecR